MFVSDIRFEREVGAPLIPSNTLTGCRFAARKVRRPFHQAAAGDDTGLRRRAGGAFDCLRWRLGFKQSSLRHVTRAP